MGEYVKSKKDMRFQSQDALKTVQSVIDDADLALNDKSRRMSDSSDWRGSRRCGRRWCRGWDWLCRTLFGRLCCRP